MKKETTPALYPVRLDDQAVDELATLYKMGILKPQEIDGETVEQLKKYEEEQ